MTFATTHFKFWLMGLGLALFSPAVFSQINYITYGSSWKYLDNDTRPAGWETSAFADGSWTSGLGQFGYGDGDEATVVNYGGCTPIASCGTKYITTYFRKTIVISNPTQHSNFTLNVKRDDGIVVYINGTERYNNNMPAGRTHATLASTAAADDGNTPQTATLLSSYFAVGTNVIAVEIHQSSTTSSDITFDMELIGNDAFSSTLTRGPYLQMGNQTAMTFHWRTSTAQDSKVDIGTSLGTYTISGTSATSTTEHIVRVSGLTADTKYYYRIGNTTSMGLDDVDKFFTTMPPANTTRKIRIAAFGDCGKNGGVNTDGNTGITYQTQSFARYQTFLTSNSIDAPDAWLVLGDNAYDAGTDVEYTNNFFGTYGSILKNHKIFPVPGNHDYANDPTRQDDHAVPYYSIFDLPSAGECGGVASNKEEYYSYDIGNIHFLALDAYGEEANKRLYTAGSPQAAWVANDLAANTKKWTVVYFHHPPYTKGSHDSDTEAELISMRTNFISTLENAGVDLVINGHSHDYERSYLMKGHYGTESTFILSGPGKHAVSSSNGKYTSNTNCPYVYNSTPSNHGTVYVVSGSTGASGNTQSNYPHDALPFAVNDGGFFYFEVDNNRLDAKFIERDGSVFDNFTIIKDVNKTTNYTINNGTSKLLTASWPGNYNWSTTASTKSITVTPPINAVTSYTVNDVMGCITDQFSITTTNLLPVSLLNYQAQLNAGKVNVTWVTTTESNSKNFTVERSQNQVKYDLVANVTAAGQSTVNHNYQVTDNNPYPGVSYYRLSQTDQDNKVVYYDVKKIINAQENFAVRQISGAANRLDLEISSPISDKVNIKIYDLSGREIWKEDINVFSGTTQKGIKLKPGSYAFEVQNSQGESVSQVAIIR